MRVVFHIVVPVVVLAALGVWVAVQCGWRSAPPPGPATVRGRVTFQGLPVAGGLVVFAPDADRGASGKAVRAETGADGTFDLSAAGAGRVAPGWYRVALAPPPAAPGGADLAAFPPALRRPDRSTVVREVTAGADHFFEFAVDVPPAPSQLTPVAGRW